MTGDESLPIYDFKIPLEIKNLEKKAEILELWETAKNVFVTNDVEKIRSSLTQITELDDSLYGVWYNLGIAKDFTGWCFNKAIELKPDHIDSWRGKGRYHELAIRDTYGDDNLDQHIHSQNWNACQSICEEIEVMNKFKKLKFNEFDEDQHNSFEVNMEIDQHQSSDGANILNLSLCCLKYSMYDEAIKLLEHHWFADTTLYWYFLGIAYRLSGNFEKALEQFDKILNLEPENVYALLQKGLILYKNEESIDEITKIIVATTLHKYLKDLSEKIARDDSVEIITNTFVDPNHDFFKICLNDCNTCFPSDPFELSFEMIFYEESEGHPETSRRFNEEIIVQLNLDTKNLYDYTKFEKIEKTWNGNYYDFKI